MSRSVHTQGSLVSSTANLQLRNARSRFRSHVLRRSMAPAHDWGQIGRPEGKCCSLRRSFTRNLASFLHRSNGCKTDFSGVVGAKCSGPYLYSSVTIGFIAASHVGTAHMPFPTHPYSLADMSGWETSCAPRVALSARSLAHQARYIAPVHSLSPFLPADLPTPRALAHSQYIGTTPHFVLLLQPYADQQNASAPTPLYALIPDDAATPGYQ